MSEVLATRDPKSGEFPLEPKVKQATISSYVAALLLTAAMTLVQDENVPLLLGFLPEAVEPFALAMLPAAASLVAGYMAKHQHRRPALGTGGQ